MKAIGQILSAVADRKAYAAGDIVRLKVHTKITYYPNHDLSGWWYTFVTVKNPAGERVGHALYSETIAFWTTEDSAEHEMVISCGGFNSSDMLTVDLFWASSKDIPFVYTGKVIHLTTRKVPITVYAPEPIPPPPDGEVPTPTQYQCPVCAAYFPSQAALSVHIATFHQEIPPTYYKCPICGLSFASQAVLDSHFATAHEEKPTPTPTCSIDADCPEGYECKAGKCVKKAEDWMKWLPWVAVGGAVLLLLPTGEKEK